MNDLNIRYSRRGILIEDDVFISGDYHIGYSDSIETMTLGQERDEISNRVRSVIDELNPTDFVINGDMFHEFTPASDEARRLYKNMVARITVDADYQPIMGNHDEPTNSKYQNLVDFENERTFKFEKESENITVTILHGHQEPESESDLYVISHLHPVVKINGIKWPVYLKGEDIYNGSDVIVLPTFTKYQDGVVISDEMKLSIDFPIVSRGRFRDLKPLVYDESEKTIREFPVLSKSSSYFGV